MKYFKHKIFNCIWAVSILLLTGCELDLQKPFDFDPALDVTDPFANITAWEWLQTRNAVDTVNGAPLPDEFQYMVAAIERAGMIDEYNGSNANRTYLLLSNNAFLGAGDIIQLVTGSSVVAAGETPEDVMARADVDVLKLVLQYHIVDTFVAQVPTLFEIGVNYVFQTLIPGEDGTIVMRRDFQYRIDINTSPAPLPTSSTSQPERVAFYNYVFRNGIGHIINDPVRNRPYPSPG